MDLVGIRFQIISFSMHLHFGRLNKQHLYFKKRILYSKYLSKV